MSLAALGAIFSTSFVVSLTGALAPGPVTTMAVREGVRRGFWAGPALAAGHGLIEGLMVIGLALGLNQLLDSDTVTASVALAGGAYLIYLGLVTVITAPRQELQLEDEGVPVGPGRGILRAIPAGVVGSLAVSGIALSVTNPFWLAWWATIGTAYIVEALDEGAIGVGTFYTAHFITDLGWLSLIAFLLAGGRRLMSRAAYRVILSACGLFLVALGGWFLTSGLGYAL